MANSNSLIFTCAISEGACFVRNLNSGKRHLQQRLGQKIGAPRPQVFLQQCRLRHTFFLMPPWQHIRLACSPDMIPVSVQGSLPDVIAYSRYFFTCGWTTCFSCPRQADFIMLRIAKPNTQQPTNLGHMLA